MKGASPYLVLIGTFIFILLAGTAILGYLYLSSFKIANSSVIRNEALLNQFLGTSETFPQPVNGIRLLSIVPQTTFKQTDDCISDKPKTDPVFCFDSLLKNGKLTINIYPNQAAIAQRTPEQINRLLNLNLTQILESDFKINSNKRELILGPQGEGEAFKW